MPNYFQLIDKQTKKVAPLIDVDNRICKEIFQIDPDPTKYIYGWFDSIGFRLAIGQKFDNIEAEYRGKSECEGTYQEGYQNLLKIVRFLKANYDSNAWYSG